MVVVFLLFLAFVAFLIIGLLPIISRQATQLLAEMPTVIAQFQDKLLRLPELYPALITEDQIIEIIDLIRVEVARFGGEVVSISVSSVVSAITLVVYAILLPLLVFFFMKDKDRIIGWARGYLPETEGLRTRCGKTSTCRLATTSAVNSGKC